MFSKRIALVLFLVLFCCFSTILLAQKKDSSAIKKRDSIARKQRLDSLNEATKNNDTAFVLQLNRLENIGSLLNEITSWLRHGFDTASIIKGLPQIQSQIELGKDGIFINKGSQQNYRNLNTSLVLYVELQRRLDIWHTRMERYIRKAIQYKNEIEIINSDSIFYKIPNDSVLRIQYAERLIQIVKQFVPVDASLKKALVQLSLTQNKVVKHRLEIEEYIDEIKLYLQENSANMFRPEFTSLWTPSTFDRPIKAIIDFSFNKTFLLLNYYLKNNYQVVVIFLLIWLMLWWFLRWNIVAIKKAGNEKKLVNAQFLVSHSFLAVGFITSVVAQFFFTNTPMIFLQMLWILMATLGTILHWKLIAKGWRKFWLVFLFIFLITCVDNIILQANRTERWVMIFLGIAGIFTGIAALQKTKRDALTIPYITIFIWLFLLQEILSVITNSFGIFTLSKIMMTGGYFNLLVAVCLLWAIRLISQYIFILSQSQHQNTKLSGYINWIRIQKNAIPILNMLGIVGWLIIFAKNLYLFTPLEDLLMQFLKQKRALGNFEFTIASIVVFFLVIYIATLLSKIVSFISNSSSDDVQKTTTSKLGSSILLIRIAIISVGILLAFAAAGIPTDRITIIIGSLSVGIGFGLQNIFNNLVSGIIIAFEKPLNLGDQIEIGGKLGTIKEIGIRSSTLSTFDGADVVIPNGDLLNQHLINWTKTHDKRRVEIIVGVKYGSNLQKAKEILNSILDSNDQIDKSPAPMVLVKEFGASSIDFRLLFWTDVGVWVVLRSEILMAIDEQFKENGIEIPYQQQDIYIKELPDNLQFQNDSKKNNNT